MYAQINSYIHCMIETSTSVLIFFRKSYWKYVLATKLGRIWTYLEWFYIYDHNARSRDKLNTLYLYYHKTYSLNPLNAWSRKVTWQIEASDHSTLLNVDLLGGASNHKST